MANVRYCIGCRRYMDASHLSCPWCKLNTVHVNLFAELLNKLDELKDILDGDET